MKPSISVSKIASLCLCVLLLTAARASFGQTHSIDVGADFTYLHTNLLPNCNCFSMNGGGGEIQAGLLRRVALLADVTVVHKGGLTPDGYSLTQTATGFGIRYFPTSLTSRLRPFGDVTVGFAHASGSLSPSNTGYGGANAFAFGTGGGFQVHLGHRLTLVPIQAEYLLTTFGNGADNQQNDFRASAGFLFRIKR